MALKKKAEMRTLAIGDIHGCFNALSVLVQIVKPTPDDLLVFLGDYIDRGLGTKAVIDFLIGLSRRVPCVFIRGNHDLVMLQARSDAMRFRGWQAIGGFATLLSYEAELEDDWASVIPASHWEVLGTTVGIHETDREIFVHGCVDPDLPMDEQEDMVLLWELFDQIRPHKSGKRVVCGHTHQLSGEIDDRGFATCIDTGAYARGGWLTCLETQSGQYWKANESGDVREGELNRR